MGKYKNGDEFDMKDPTANRHTKGRITRHFKVGGVEKYEVTTLEPSLWNGKLKLTGNSWEFTEDKLEKYIIEDLS